MIHKTSYPQVLYEDNHLLVINKPAGSLVQGDRTGDLPLVETCKQYIKEVYDKPGAVFLGVVHRLDRPVSGVLVFARTSKALDRMNRLFRDRAVRKTYWAIVSQAPPVPEGRLVHWLRKDPARNITTAYEKEVHDSKKAVLKYRLLARREVGYLLEVEPLTGRPHQIRVQLAGIGCSIQGDIKYGYPHPNADGNINLHARRLTFVHPVRNDELNLLAQLPQHKGWEAFATLNV